MAEPQDQSAIEEHQFHSYQSSVIPFYVRLLWVAFYSLAIFYCLLYLFPSIRDEFRPRASQRVQEKAAATTQPESKAK